ncbi:MAG: hypothetical protein P0S95_03230 [Rhabdochlamydiaceae bacterium]|nr:hypothetical protein [Candidatus Amphrikana amoebophyrae]
MLRSVFKALILLLAIPLYSGPPTRAQFNNFYQQYIGEVRAKVPGKHPNSGITTGLTRFTNQHFMLWDYLEGETESTYVTHFQDVLSMLQARQMKRLIVFVKDPNSTTSNSFFQPSNTSTDSFIGQMKEIYSTMLAIQPDFYISIFFESQNFTSDAPAGTYPTVNPQPQTYLSGYFPGINNMLDWAKDVIAQGTSVGIQEIAFDPQYSGATKDIQQRLYNYVDEYKYLNGLEAIKIGSTLGVDEAPETYANLATFPVPDSFALGYGNPPNFPTTSFPNPAPTWQRSPTDASLLQSVYIQVYETDIPAIFAAGATTTSASHSGVTAGSYFNSLLREYPYLTGVGTISATQHATTVTGHGTNFTNYSDPLLFVPYEGNPIKKLCTVNGVNSPTSLSTTAATATVSNVSFQRTEISAAWTGDLAGATSLTPAQGQTILDNIVWMFSVNYQTNTKTPTASLYFFGNWLLDDFMDFIDATITNNNKESIAPFKMGDGTALIFPSHSFAIYDYHLIKNVVSGQTTYNGVKIDWNLESTSQ